MNHLAMAVGMAALAAVGGCAKREPSAPRDLAPGREPVAVQRERVVTAMATVEQIDHETRMVTLRAEDGHKFVFRAGEEVRNLAQVRKGDRVVTQYYEGIAAEVRTPTAEERANPRSLVEAAGRAPVGGTPAAAGARVVRVLATITAINRATEHVTLRGPEGDSTTVKVRDPRNLDKVQVGDPIIITYTEAVGISVEPAPEAAAPTKKAEAPPKKKKK
jgi:hypothetical protein